MLRGMVSTTPPPNLAMTESFSSLLGLHHDTEDAAQLAADPQWRIQGWRGQFADARTEAGYARYSQPFVVRQLTLALAVWAVLLLLFAFSDYGALGWSRAFQALLAMRVGVVLCLGALVYAVARKPEIAAHGGWTSAVELAGFLSFMLLYVLRPEITLWVYAMTLMLLIMLFVLVPNRLLQAVGVATSGALLTVAMLAYSGRTGYQLAAFALILAMPIGIGYISAWRVHTLQRQQYALLMLARRNNAQLREEMAQRAVLQEALHIQATTDPLTGLNNRREYEKRFAHELARARRDQSALSLMMFDLDFFRRVNDQYGHAAGDEVLRVVARLCGERFRSVDIAGRLGGEEFVVLMPGTALHAAGDVALRFLRALEETDIVFDGATLRVQATAGVAQLLPVEDQLEPLLRRADGAMYAGKQSGRNRVMLAIPEGDPVRWQGAAAAEADA